MSKNDQDNDWGIIEWEYDGDYPDGLRDWGPIAAGVAKRKDSKNV